jgi:hypothetical protein
VVSSTNETDCHDINEILLKVALNIINQSKPNHHKDSYAHIDIMLTSNRPKNLSIVGTKKKPYGETFKKPSTVYLAWRSIVIQRLNLYANECLGVY